MRLRRRLALLFTPTPRAAATLPVAPLLRASAYSPSPAPAVALDATDTEVLRLWRAVGGDTEALMADLSRTEHELDREIAALHAELARLEATPRFKP